jgi:hypothetical protein
MMLLVVTASNGWAESVVVIEATRLVPPVLRTGDEERVRFVNQTGRPVHIDFLGRAGQHHVFEVRGEIWAVFHRTGPHRYVVHFEDTGSKDLGGLIEVGEVPKRGPGLVTCGGITVVEICVEP